MCFTTSRKASRVGVGTPFTCHPPAAPPTAFPDRHTAARKPDAVLKKAKHQHRRCHPSAAERRRQTEQPKQRLRQRGEPLEKKVGMCSGEGDEAMRNIHTAAWPKVNRHSGLDREVIGFRSGVRGQSRGTAGIPYLLEGFCTHSNMSCLLYLPSRTLPTYVTPIYKHTAARPSPALPETK